MVRQELMTVQKNGCHCEPYIENIGFSFNFTLLEALRSILKNDKLIMKTSLIKEEEKLTINDFRRLTCQCSGTWEIHIEYENGLYIWGSVKFFVKTLGA